MLSKGVVEIVHIHGFVFGRWLFFLFLDHLPLLNIFIHFFKFYINYLWFISLSFFHIVPIFLFIEPEYTLLHLLIIWLTYIFLWNKTNVQIILSLFLLILRVLFHQRYNIYEIRVVSIYVTQLYFNEVANHQFSVGQRFAEKILHDSKYP